MCNRGLLRVSLLIGVILLMVVFMYGNKTVEAKNIRSFQYTALQTVDSMGAGWNLGNTFDSAMNPDASETYWGQPVTTWEMISDIKAKGFKTIRIPTTWTYKTSGYPDYIIDPAWLERVHDVVTFADEEDLYIILNMHHEGKNIIPTYAKQEECTRMISCIWSQIAEKFGHFGNNLIFETQNEPREEGSDHEWTGGTNETRAVVNAYNIAAVKAIRETGGNNLERKIMIPGVGASGDEKVLDTIVIPENDENIIISCHYYSPFDFAFDENGRTAWGSDSDKKEMDSFMNMLYDKFVSRGYPVVIGECGSINKNNTSARAAHAEYLSSSARKRGITCVAWDNGNPGTGEETFGHYNRNERSWYFPEVVEAFINGEAKYAKEFYVEGEDTDLPPDYFQTPGPGPDADQKQETIQGSNPDIRQETVQAIDMDNKPCVEQAVNVQTIKSTPVIPLWKIVNVKNTKIKKTGKRYILKKGKEYYLKIGNIKKTDTKYRSSDKRTVSVTKKGKIKAKKRGKCSIKIYGKNIIRTTIKISVL